MFEDKRHHVNQVVSMKNHVSLKDKCEDFTIKMGKEEIKINFAIFNQDCLCVKIHKSATIMELMRYIAWAGFRTSVDQILLKIKYAMDAGQNRVYNIQLDKDFNVNIVILDGPVSTREVLQACNDL